MPVRRSVTCLLAAMLLAPTSPATAAEPTPLGELGRTVEAILDTADPKLMEVLVTRRDDDGKLAFEIVKTPTLGKAREVVSGLLGKPGVIGVEMNQPVKAYGYNDPLFRYQWGMNPNHLDVQTLHRMTARDKAHPRVAVVDTGVWVDHPDLKGRVTAGYNAFNLRPTPVHDANGHGTHVAGVIAAKANNRGGVVGLSRTAIIVPVKVLDVHGSGSSASVARGIYWAAYRSHVINLSLGSYGYSPAVCNAVRAARAKGRVVVAATGNGGTDQPSYPASCPGVIGVGAHNSGGEVAPFSNYGPQVDLLAPGTSIYSTMVPWNWIPNCPAGYYCKIPGTSMAAPHISALAAMSMAHCGYKANTVIDRLQRWSEYWLPDEPGFARDYFEGFGSVYADGFLSCRTWPTPGSTAANESGTKKRAQ